MLKVTIAFNLFSITTTSTFRVGSSADGPAYLPFNRHYGAGPISLNRDVLESHDIDPVWIVSGRECRDPVQLADTFRRHAWRLENRGVEGVLRAISAIYGKKCSTFHPYSCEQITVYLCCPRGLDAYPRYDGPDLVFREDRVAVLLKLLAERHLMKFDASKAPAGRSPPMDSSGRSAFHKGASACSHFRARNVLTCA